MKIMLNWISRWICKKGNVIMGILAKVLARE
jgi:hypothetical protein